MWLQLNNPKSAFINQTRLCFCTRAKLCLLIYFISFHVHSQTKLTHSDVENGGNERQSVGALLCGSTLPHRATSCVGVVGFEGLVVVMQLSPSVLSLGKTLCPHCLVVVVQGAVLFNHTSVSLLRAGKCFGCLEIRVNLKPHSDWQPKSNF